MTLLAAAAGYLIGSAPTAEWLGRLWGVELRQGGTGNPGANNARRLGGLPLATVVLTVEIGKGVLAVALGFSIAGDVGAATAGVAAAAGNVFNVWYRFEGGKGLGISAGVVIATWPAIFGPILAVLVVAVLITRSSGWAALAAMGALNLFAVVWVVSDLSGGPWGLGPGPVYFILSVGLTVVLFPKHLRDALRPPVLA